MKIVQANGKWIQLKMDLDLANTVGTLFDQMDEWRGLPGYQLERHASLVFSPYLHKALYEKLGISIADPIIPEFPIIKNPALLNPPTDDLCKADFFALSEEGDTAIFVKLKTEDTIPLYDRDKHLLAVCEVGFHKLLEDVLDLFRSTFDKRKYWTLLNHLESMGLLRVPKDVRLAMGRHRTLCELLDERDKCIAMGYFRIEEFKEKIEQATSRDNIIEASSAIEITTSVTKTIIIYIQPIGGGEGIISFKDFRFAVLEYGDPFSRRLARSLWDWEWGGIGWSMPDLDRQRWWMPEDDDGKYLTLAYHRKDVGGFGPPLDPEVFLWDQADILRSVVAEASLKEIEFWNHRIQDNLPDDVWTWLPNDLLFNPDTPSALFELELDPETSQLARWKARIAEAIKKPMASQEEIDHAVEWVNLETFLGRFL